MKHKSFPRIMVIVIGLLIPAAGVIYARDVGQTGPVSGQGVSLSAVPSKMSYQGMYTEDGAPVTGMRNMVFKIFTNSNCDGSPLQTITKNNTQVTNGLFTVTLDVTAANFNGQGLWLRVEVNAVPLSCAEILPAPYALFSAKTAAGQTWSGSFPGGNAQAATNTATTGNGLAGFSDTQSYRQGGVVGINTATTGAGAGVHGESSADNGRGIQGVSTLSTGLTYGVFGKADSTDGKGVLGWVTAADAGAYGVWGFSNSSTGYAGYFDGRVNVTGNLTKGGGAFRIDHPLDPENKYLYHSFVESPDMMNIYNGNVVLDNKGEAWVELPAWFGVLNGQYRYQLTPIGGPGPNLYIAQRIENNRFKIAGGTSGLEVSWQVTGIRQDPYAVLNRIPVEEYKPADERGTYLHPAVYGQPEAAGLSFQHQPAIELQK